MDITLQRIIDELRFQGKKQYELTDYLSLTHNAFGNWKAGKNQSYTKYIHAIAEFLGVSVEYLKGETDLKQKHPTPQITEDVVTFPVLGDVAAGYEHIAVEDWDGATVEIPRAYLRGRPESDYIVLRVCGDSMYPFYLDGDKVLVLRTPTLKHSGQVGCIRYGGENTTLKKVEFVMGEDWMKLIPLNPLHPPRTIEGVDLEQCSVIGIPKLVIREIKE